MTVDDRDTRELLEDTMGLLELIDVNRKLSCRYVYPPRASVANTSCNGIHKYLCWNLSERVFLSHLIVILETAKSIYLRKQKLSLSLFPVLCGQSTGVGITAWSARTGRLGAMNDWQILLRQ